MPEAGPLRGLNPQPSRSGSGLAALGDNPAKEQIDAIVSYGLEQHMVNYP